MQTRRTFLAGLMSAAAMPGLATSSALAAGEHPSVTYMKQVAKDLLAAHRQATVPAFLRVVQRHAAIADISGYVLGKYSGNLQSSQRAKYQKGVATYMARYFAMQSHDVTIAKYEIGDAQVDPNKDVIVDSKVYLVTGQTYSVGWKLIWQGGRYKVRDAKVLGFWLTSFQKSDFVSFLDKRNGDINKLITALYG